LSLDDRLGNWHILHDWLFGFLFFELFLHHRLFDDLDLRFFETMVRDLGHRLLQDRIGLLHWDFFNKGITIHFFLSRSNRFWFRNWLLLRNLKWLDLRNLRRRGGGLHIGLSQQSHEVWQDILDNRLICCVKSDRVFLLSEVCKSGKATQEQHKERDDPRSSLAGFLSLLKRRLGRVWGRLRRLHWGTLRRFNLWWLWVIAVEGAFCNSLNSLQGLHCSLL
jgi:hypothetical protein